MTDVQTLDGRNQRRVRNAERIYDAAMDLFQKRPYGDVSVESICQAAGVGRATFFRIFDGKAGLLKEFNRRMVVDIEERLDLAGEKNVRTVLTIIGDGIADAWSQSTPGATEMMIEFSQSVSLANMHAAHPELLALFVQTVRDGQNAGDIKHDFPPELLGSLALFQISAAATFWVVEPGHDLHQLMKAAVENFLKGAQT